MGVMKRFRNLDFYRKVPREYSEATFPGASISIVATVCIGMLALMEITAFMSTTTNTNVVVDQLNNDLLRISFNFSFPALSCEFASLDVSDVIGMHRINLTKTVRKYPINSDLQVVGPEWGQRADIKHEDIVAEREAVLGVEADGQDSDDYEEAAASARAERASDPALNVFTGAYELDENSFKASLKEYQVMVINFYAPWCPWSQRLAPVWEATAEGMHAKYPPAEDKRLLIGKVDCVQHPNFCRDSHIQGFPSIRIFKGGTDVVSPDAADPQHHDHASYVGDRTTEAITAFVENLIPAGAVVRDASAKGNSVQLPKGVHNVATHYNTQGCQIEGFVLVKKVPGQVFVTAHSGAHSFDPNTLNMTHTVHSFYFGKVMARNRIKTLERLHPLGLTPDWKDKLADRRFITKKQNVTFEHYMQVVLTTVQPMSGGKAARADAYEYTLHSHNFAGHATAQTQFRFDPSPMQVIVTEEAKYGMYHFVTTMCAIIGGVYTVAGMLDGIVNSSVNAIKTKKDGIGKLG